MSENNIVTCVYCGHQYPNGTPAAKHQLLTDNIKICEKHPLRDAGLCGMDCDAAFDDWYSIQRNKLNDEQVCRMIWQCAWNAAQKEWREPLTKKEIEMVATYAPEGVTDDDVEILVRKIEQMHGLTHNL